MAGEIAGGAGIDARDFKDLVRVLRRESPELKRGLTRSLRAAGEIVATEARVKAGEHSKSIPPTVKTRVTGASVEIRAGKDVPLAALYEIGNKKGARGGTFRHPVFGNRENWVEQQRWPFIAPAVDENLPELEAAVGRALDELASRLSVGK